MEKRILLVGGGSGGHAYPLIAVAESLRKRASELGIELELMMLGGSFIDKAAKECKIPYRKISSGKLRAYSSIENFLDVGRFLLGLVQSFWHIFWYMPDAVFTKGGAASVPPALVAKLFFIPLYTHESDSVPGLANVLLGKIAKKVFLSFKTAEKFFNVNKVIYSGNPIRQSLLTQNREEAFRFFEFFDKRPTILVLGGSQGAKVINDMILSSLVLMTEKYNVIHQCGEGQMKTIQEGVELILKEGADKYSESVKKYYRYFGFLNEHELSLAFSAADIVITRAGGTLFEIARAGKPAIVIPIAQSRGNHQYFNAFEFSLRGGVLIEEKNLMRVGLLRAVESLLVAETYAKTSESIKSFAMPGASDVIARELLK